MQALESGLGERSGICRANCPADSGSVAIGRALVKRPKVLLADEPTGNPDESMRDEIMEVLEVLWKEHGLTFIMVTHDSTIARRAPRPATTRQGRVTVTAHVNA